MLVAKEAVKDKIKGLNLDKRWNFNKLKGPRAGRIAVGLVIGVALLSGCMRRMDTRVQFGVSGEYRGGDSFYMAVGDYYRVPEREIVIIRDRRIPDEEIPVVLFISSRAHVSSQAVLDLRLEGSSWMDISMHFGLEPEVFYVPVEGNYGPPYGKAYGYYRNHKKGWNNVRLEDSDIVNFVNLRFVSEHYGTSPDKVIHMRSEGRNFREINDNFHKGKKDRGDKGRGNRGGDKDRENKQD